MSQIKIYIDEDAMDSDLVAALRSRGVAAVTALVDVSSTRSTCPISIDFTRNGSARAESIPV